MEKEKVKFTHGAILPKEGFVRLPGVLAVFPVSRSKWWAGIQAGIYPAGVKLGSSSITAWRVDDIRKLIANIGESE